MNGADIMRKSSEALIGIGGRSQEGRFLTLTSMNHCRCKTPDARIRLAQTKRIEARTRPPASHQVPHAEGGLALLTVLWAVLILGLLASQVLNTGRGDLQLAMSIAAEVEAGAMADGAVEAALSALVGRPSPSPSIRTDGSIYAWRYNGGTVFVRVTSETARIDLNNASPQLLSRLITAAGASNLEADAVVQAILEFRNPVEGQPAGAPRGTAAAPKGSPFQSVQELMSVTGISGDLFAKIEPALTVHSGKSLPDTQSALPIVKAALSGGSSVQAAYALDLANDSIALDDHPRVIQLSTDGRSTNAVIYRVEAAAAAPGGGRSSGETIALLAPGSILPYRRLAQRNTDWLFKLNEQEADHAE